MDGPGLVHVWSMTAYATAPKQERADHGDAPWNTHWSRTCQHDLRPRLKQYPSGLRAKMQCRECGQGVGHNISMRGVTELWDEDLDRRVSAEYQSACDEYRKNACGLYFETRGQNSREWWAVYNGYLRSEIWRAKRQFVFDRCGGLCESCGQNDAEHVHHIKYPDVFGHEPLWDLRAVCVPCHKIIHPHMD